MQKQPDQKQLQEKLAELKSQESELKDNIELCEKESHCNQVELIRLKKQLSTLKEQIKQIKSSLIPDQLA